jgi:hypothetical protein
MATIAQNIAFWKHTATIEIYKKNVHAIAWLASRYCYLPSETAKLPRRPPGTYHQSPSGFKTRCSHAVAPTAGAAAD